MEQLYKLGRMKTTSSSGVLKTIYIIMVVIYCYFPFHFNVAIANGCVCTVVYQ